MKCRDENELCASTSHSHVPKPGHRGFWVRMYSLVVVGALTLGGTHAWLSDVLSEQSGAVETVGEIQGLQSSVRFALDRAEILLEEARSDPTDPGLIAELEQLRGLFMTFEGELDCDAATARRAAEIVDHWIEIGDQWPHKADTDMSGRESVAVTLCERLVDAIRCICGGC